MPAIVDFQPYMGKVRKPGTGCISQINDHLFEGRYSPTWIAEMKAELAELKRQKGNRH